MNVFINALLNTIMGMGTVFAVLIVISLIISLFRYVPNLERKLAGIKRSRSRNKKAGAQPEAAPKRPVLTSEEQRMEEPEELIDDGELVAVITAAIAAASGGAVSVDRLVVRSIRRVKRR